MEKEELFWRMLTANFLLLIGIACMVAVYVLGMNGASAGILMYAALFCIGWGIVRGLFAIIDRNRAKEE